MVLFLFPTAWEGCHFYLEVCEGWIPLGWGGGCRRAIYVLCPKSEISKPVAEFTQEPELVLFMDYLLVFK